MTGLDRLRSPERFGAWFCGIALNVAPRWLRRLRPESVGLPGGDLVSGEPGPEEVAEIADYAEALAYPTGTAELAAEIRQQQEALMRELGASPQDP